MVQSDKIRQEFSKRLVQALNEANYPPHGRGMKLARELGVSSKAVSKWMSGESLPRPAMMLSLAKVLRVDPLYLQHGEMAQAGELRLYKALTRGSFPLIDWSDIENFRNIDQTDFVRFRRYASGSILDTDEGYWLIVEDDSMTSPVGLCVPQASMILVETKREPTNGDLVIAQIPAAKKATFKKLVIDEGTNHRYLKSLNSSYGVVEIDDSCKFLGVVVESRLSFVTPDPADVTYI
jgi:SOS-response transcriptional repressor LexA